LTIFPAEKKRTSPRTHGPLSIGTRTPRFMLGRTTEDEETAVVVIEEAI
jgi:hypothetical protein